MNPLAVALDKKFIVQEFDVPISNPVGMTYR
jgi:hypothetical protein